MIKHLFGHLRHNVIGYIALFVALGGTSYASVEIPQLAATSNAAKAAKAGITCSGSCPASKVYWAYIGARGAPGYGANGVALAPGAPQVYDTAVGGVPATVLHLGVGNWLVQFFGQDLTNCGRFANLTHDRGSATVSGYDSLNPYTGAIHVMTTDTTGSPSDLDFAVLALCGKQAGIQIGAAPPATGAK